MTMALRTFHWTARKLILLAGGLLCLLCLAAVTRDSVFMMRGGSGGGGGGGGGGRWDVYLLRRYYEDLTQRTKGMLGSLLFPAAEPETLPDSNCTTGEPCVYDGVGDENVDLRIIVITYNRARSLAKLLDSLQDLELDGDRAVLEIWVDRNAKGSVHNETLSTALDFEWSRGPTRVHVQKRHAGIMGQWIDTWRPRNAPRFQKRPEVVRAAEFKAADHREVGLILEDDLNVSSQAWRWLKAAHRKYLGRSDYAGASLWSDFVQAHNTGKRLSAARNESAFMYVCIGTWGFAPAPKLWAEFQDWFHMIRSSKNASSFHPYVEGAVPTGWYKQFEARGTQDGMWEMWFIYFAHVNKAFTVMNNLGAMNGDTKSCLSINRREVGLHYPTKGNENLCELLKTWNSSYVDLLPDKPVKFDWSGNVVP